jgi:hypothetical protein
MKSVNVCSTRIRIVTGSAVGFKAEISGQDLETGFLQEKIKPGLLCHEWIRFYIACYNFGDKRVVVLYSKTPEQLSVQRMREVIGWRTWVFSA